MRRAAVVLRLLVALGLLGLVVGRADPGEALARLRAAPWWTMAAPIVLLTLNSGIHALRLLVLLPAPRPPGREVLRAVLVGHFFGLFLPTGGGDAAKVVALRRSAGSLETAVAAMAVSRVLELVPWGLLLVWGAWGVLPGRLPWMVTLAWVTAAGMGGALLLVALARGAPAALARRIPGALGDRLRRVAAFRAPPGGLAACLGLTVPFALLNCLAVWAVLRGYGAGLSYPTVLGLVPTLDVLIALPVTIAGVGVREGVFVHGLAAWDIAPATALAVAFTRWTGELFRAGLGGLWFAAGRG